MSYALNAIAAPDAYNAAATIDGVPIRRVNIDASNQAIYWQLKLSSSGGGSGVWDSSETYMGPGSRSVSRPSIVGVRVRAALPAASLPAGANRAVVTVEAVTT